MHISVLLEEFLEFYEGKKLLTFVDGTLGLGGHSYNLLKKHPEIQRLFAIDQDKEALALSKERLSEFSDKVSFHHANFNKIPDVLKSANIQGVDGIFLDLGVSSLQLDTGRRGFSFQQEGPLDMRMNQEGSISAFDIVNSWDEKDLVEIFFKLGEERYSRRAARAIVDERKKNLIQTTSQLKEILQTAVPKTGKIHPATRIFQALRLAVNEELDVLSNILPKLLDCLNIGGILGVISFHSLEDRIVKWCFRKKCEEDTQFSILTKKPIIPSDIECSDNPRSRSAKMRFCSREVAKNYKKKY